MDMEKHTYLISKFQNETITSSELKDLADLEAEEFEQQLDDLDWSCHRHDENHWLFE